MPAPDGLISSRELCNDVIGPRHISDGALNSVDMFATGLQAVQIVSALPACNPAEEGQFAYLTTDGLLYKCDGTSWINVTDTSEITGQITTTQIADDAITTPKIAANQVTAALIAANTITASQIAANTITAGEIQAGAIGTSELAAGAVTTTKLVVSSFDNLLVNAIFEQGAIPAGPDSNDYTSGTGGTWSDSVTARAGTRAARFDVNTQSAEARLVFNGPIGASSGEHMAASEGDKFYFEAFARYIDTAATVQPRVALRFLDKNGNQVGSTTTTTWATLTTSYVSAFVTATAPANTAFVVAYIAIPSGNASTVAMLFDSGYLRRMIGSAVIDSLDVGKLTAGDIDTGEITIKSTLTMGTDGIIRTATSGQRIEIRSDAADRVQLYSGLSSEDAPGLYRTYDALSGRIGMVLRSPRTTIGGTPAGSLYIDFQTEPVPGDNDNPRIRFGYDGQSNQEPEIVLRTSENMKIMNDSDSEILPGTGVTFTPTLRAQTTNPSNYSAGGRWIRVGNVVHVYLQFEMNASFNGGSGLWYFDPAADGLPTPWSVFDGTKDIAVGHWIGEDTSASSNRYAGPIVVQASSQDFLFLRDATSGTTWRVGAGDPFTWASSDWLTGHLTYITLDTE